MLRLLHFVQHVTIDPFPPGDEIDEDEDNE